ncbi:hypothetical protein FSP39_018788 [Pinctada imbricata]|uniref:MARVEL domain-containing protein n=1 Tax=Pinctada imbricata TaxID=66713 RepID=A0AA88YRV7_PINIB|nr:hypothetical protein FSP39_018788 [Pinctada imbricata]
MNFSIEPLKEPRGFLRIIQWVLSIFAFATTTSVNTMLGFEAKNCPPNTNPIRESVQVAYPFDLEHESYTTPLCRLDNSTIVNSALLQGSKSSAEFYVFVGVMVFLYCIASVIIYLFFNNLYEDNKWPVVDFVLSAVFALLWLISSSAWAQGVVNLKYFTDLDECGVFKSISDCQAYGCTQFQFPNFASLNVSIIFGFLNMVVWIANLWFLYKETPWFKAKQEANTSSPQQQQTPTDPSRI